jgi:hypothetical protein
MQQITSTATSLEVMDDTIHPNWSTFQDHPSGPEKHKEDNNFVHEECLDTIQQESNRHMVALPCKQDKKPKFKIKSVFGRFQTTMLKLQMNSELLNRNHRTKFDLPRSYIIESIENPHETGHTSFKGTLKPYSVQSEPPRPLFRSKLIRVLQNSALDGFGPPLAEDACNCRPERKPPDRFSVSTVEQADQEG